MKIAITGSSGLIGSVLTAVLRRVGHEVRPLVRDPGRAAAERGAVFWDPATGTVDAAGLEGLDAVIHLAGESIVGWWTEAKKARIRESRVRGTALLSTTLTRLDTPPRTLLSASAVGYYGSRDPAETVDEGSPSGQGFLARVGREWEEAAAPAAGAGIRVVNLRFGVVLSTRGGMLAKMLPVFRLGFGGKVGRGRQPLSWIALDDVGPAVLHLLEHEELSGPVNIVAPNPVTNAEFVDTLGRVLDRPTPFTLPAPVARLALGEMAEEMLLGGARVVPRKLLESGFHFAYPELEGALRHILGRPADHPSTPPR